MKFIFLFFTVISSFVPNMLWAQTMPDTTGLPSAVTKYIADLSGTIANLNLENDGLKTGLETQKKEREALQSACAAAAKKAETDIGRLNTTVDNQQEQIEALKGGKKDDGKEVERLRKENKDLLGELENVRKNMGKLQADFDAQQEEAKEIKALKAEADKIPDLTARQKELEDELAKAQQVAGKAAKAEKEQEKLVGRLQRERDQLQIDLNKTQQELAVLKKDCEAYAAKVREDLAKLEKDVAGVMGSPSLSITKAERQRLVDEARRLKDVVSKSDVQRHQQAFAKINQIFAFGEIMDDARAQLMSDYDSRSIAAAISNLRNADANGFSTGVKQEVVNIVALLEGYCKEYVRVKDFFDLINDAKDPEITESYIPSYLAGKYSVNPAYSFLRKELEKRQANLGDTSQPFRAAANCSTN